jgi:hypothetical protein
MPPELDVIFISAFTEAAALAYALALLFRSFGARTALGGPHARSFPADASRFFDAVVVGCDDNSVDEILRGEYTSGAVFHGQGKRLDVPSLEERRPDVDSATLIGGRHWGISVVPLLASTGCPYGCDFCVDWNNPYIARSSDELQADLVYASRTLPGRFLAFHDPNFGIRFDQTLQAFDSVPPNQRNPYLIESTLSVLKENRLRRLAETNCVFVAPGIESWTNYGNKAGTGGRKLEAKLEQMLVHFDAIAAHIPEVQANLMFGNETDEGDAPVELTCEFIRRRPNVCPVISYPLAYGGTLLRQGLREDGRLLPLPPIYYVTPLPTFITKNYTLVSFYSGLITMLEASIRPGVLAARLTRLHSFAICLMHLLRSIEIARYVRVLRDFLLELQTDRPVGRFADRTSNEIPAQFDHLIDCRLGRYAELLPRSERHYLSSD